MPPTYQQLKLQVWWILSDPAESHDRYLEEYGAFFSEQALLLDVDATFSFGEVCHKQSRNLYEESIYQVDCTIEWPGITWFGPTTKHLQVLINEKNRFVELYLHLKIPPMLMGEVVSDIPARPGSAAAAAPLRWERYLAIGCNCIGGAVRTASLCGGLFLKLVVRDHSPARRVVGRLSQRCAHGTLISYAPIRTYSPNNAAFKWSHEVQVRCEVRQKTLPFPRAFKVALHITFDVLDQMVLVLESEFGKLVREIETRSEKEPLVVERALSHIVSSIDARNVVVFSRAFYAACSLFHDEKPPQLVRGTCLVRSIFVTPGQLIFRPAQVHFENRILRKFNSEFAIRMSFRDDNLDKLSFTLNLHSSRDTLLDAVVESFLRRRVHVCAREIKFLAPCTSQLRDHG